MSVGPSVRPFGTKLQNPATITAGRDCGLAKWIIDDSCLVGGYFFTHNVHMKYILSVCSQNKNTRQRQEPCLMGHFTFVLIGSVVFPFWFHVTTVFQYLPISPSKHFSKKKPAQICAGIFFYNLDTILNLQSTILKRSLAFCPTKQAGNFYFLYELNLQWLACIKVPIPIWPMLMTHL